MKQIAPLSASFAVASLLALAPALSANQVPIAVTGFTQNTVLEVGQTFPGNITATQDAGVGTSGNTWYQLGFNGDSTGLPTGPTVAQDDPTITFQLAPFSANDSLLLDRSNVTGTLTLVTPQDNPGLTLIAASGNGPEVINFTLHFADSSTQSGSVRVPDWFDVAPTAYDAGGRVSSNGVELDSGAPNLFLLPLTFTDLGVNLTSIDFAFTGPSTQEVGIMALSGGTLPTPEPGSIVLAAVGLGLVLLGSSRVRRGRTRKTVNPRV